MTSFAARRRWTRGVLAATAIALAGAPPLAAACDLCAIYTGSLMRQDKTGFFLGASGQYTGFGSVREDRRSVPNAEHEWMRSSITQLVGGYQVLPWLGLQANLPLVSREYQRLEEAGLTRGDASGLGDVSFVARVTPLSRATGDSLVHLELLAGVKTPTGDSDRLSEELEHDDEGDHGEETGSRDSVARVPRHEEHGHESAVHGHDLALGSGSVDGLVGLSFYADWRRIFVNAAVQYVMRGDGDFGYEYANDLTWEASPGFYVVADHPWTGAARFVASGESKGRDHQKGELVGDTAITAVYVGPGFTMTWGDFFHAELSVDLPVMQDTTGRQIVADYRIRAGASWRF